MLSEANAAVQATYNADWGRIVATLIRSFGDFDLAEEAAQDAFTAAVDQWRDDAIPDLPAAWIIQTAKHKAIDRLRRRKSFSERVESYASELPTTTEQPEYAPEEISDDRLRLIFTCCHPALAPEAAMRVIDQIRDGSPVFAYYPDPAWLTSSPFLSPRPSNT